jgi:orotidine-5'-phosphate decarboxylase
MSIDILQEKIRKTKSPIIVDLAVRPDHIPEFLRDGKNEAEALDYFCRELLNGLKGKVPGVRFSFDQWALLGSLDSLFALTKLATELGYYVVMDGPAVLSPWAAQRASTLFDTFCCDSLILCPYIGSDAMKPFVPFCKEGKSVFFAARTANKSAAELQDIMTGTRLIHAAVADHVKRLGEPIMGKCGYSQMGVLTAATNANAVSGLRMKFKTTFLLVDGLDYPGGNGKNCSYGFDRFGHGCALSVGPEITAAWAGEDCDPHNFVELAVQAADRIRNNMTRYVTIL